MASVRELLAAKRAAAKQQAVPAARPESQGRAVPVLSSAPTPQEQAILDAHRKAEAATAKAEPPRLLMETAPDVPYVFHSEDDSPEATAWKTALLAPMTTLGVWTDGEHAWLAVEAEGQTELLLIHRLPLLSRHTGLNPLGPNPF